MTLSFSDRLAAAVRRTRTTLCVGIDPRVESLPLALHPKTRDPEAVADAYLTFGKRVVDIVDGLVPVVKPQSAFFEAAGAPGVAAMAELLTYARSRGLMTILDAKRGDIASTAQAYAQSAFEVFGADSLTVNPYLGRDAVEPFIAVARQHGCGLFVLVRTSNPGSDLFQGLMCDGKPLYRHVAESVASWNRENLGACGLGDVGAVVGATHPRELAELRALLPEVWFLIPGYGAQGGTAKDVALGYRPDGLGALVNSSRGITFPFRPDDVHWESAIAEATRKAIAELRID